MSIDKQMKQHPTCRQQYKYTYLSGPLGLFAIHIIKPDGTAEINYIHTDHLGSWNTITDESGNLLQELSFDACKVKLGFCECSETKTLVEPISYEARGREGNRRDPATWENYNYNMPSFITDRGYTGHVKQPFGLLISANQLRMLIPQRNDCGEHLDEFILINMNGRMYDPETARFLSPDVVIADPSNPASYNPYAYVLNNPLKYTDPSGYFVDPVSITAYIIAGAILYSSFAKQNADPATGKWDWNFTNWSSEDKPGWMLGITINTSFTNTTFFASMNWSNGSNTTLGYNTQYGWGGGSAPQNMYFPNYNSGASEAAAVSSIARMDRSIYFQSTTNYMDFLISQSHNANSLAMEQGLLACDGCGSGAQGTIISNYSEYYFSQSGYQNSYTSAEGVGMAGGFYYTMGCRVMQTSNGNWFVYASASAWAPVAEALATKINYLSSVTVRENGTIVSRENLRVWDSEADRFNTSDYTFIGDGYLKLPSSANNVSIEIRITYNIYQFFNGHSFPNSPYIHKISF